MLTKENSVDAPLLTPYRWKNRVLVVPNEGEEFKDAQRARGLGGENGPYRGVDDSSLEELRNSHELAAFSVALFGKDGIVKARWEGIASIGELFDIIDAMPMRRTEMREKSQGTSR